MSLYIAYIHNFIGLQKKRGHMIDGARDIVSFAVGYEPAVC